MGALSHRPLQCSSLPSAQVSLQISCFRHKFQPLHRQKVTRVGGGGSGGGRDGKSFTMGWYYLLFFRRRGICLVLQGP